MLVEVAKPVTLLIVFSILSLYAVFSTAFLVPSSDMHQRIFDSLSRLALAAVISLIGGLILRGRVGRRSCTASLSQNRA
jgi:hypothetical protein